MSHTILIDPPPQPKRLIKLRDEVLQFACEMSRTMDEKSRQDPRERNFVECLQEIQVQMKRLEEQINNGGVSSNFPQVYHRLVHIANFAMLAYNKVKDQ